MTTLRIRTKIVSQTLDIPELNSLLGKVVDIEITEREEPKHVRWATAEAAAAELTNYDFDAASLQRSYDRDHAEDHVS